MHSISNNFSIPLNQVKYFLPRYIRLFVQKNWKRVFYLPPFPPSNSAGSRQSPRKHTRSRRFASATKKRETLSIRKKTHPRRNSPRYFYCPFATKRCKNVFPVRLTMGDRSRLRDSVKGRLYTDHGRSLCRKANTLVTLLAHLFPFFFFFFICMYIYVCVCVCVCRRTSQTIRARLFRHFITGTRVRCATVRAKAWRKKKSIPVERRGFQLAK